jgi:hypothetical protein
MNSSYSQKVTKETKVASVSPLKSETFVNFVSFCLILSSWICLTR